MKGRRLRRCCRSCEYQDALLLEEDGEQPRARRLVLADIRRRRHERGGGPAWRCGVVGWAEPDELFADGR